MKRAAFFVLGAVMVAVIAVAVSYYSKDLPRSNPVLLALFPNDTNYSPGYRESGFREIVPGMTASEVRDRLGQPLSIREFAQGRFVREFAVTEGGSPESGGAQLEQAQPKEPDQLAFIYSEPGRRFDNYYVRTVVVDRTGRVISKGAEFYSD
jgi:hypothetical protein